MNKPILWAAGILVVLTQSAHADEEATGRLARHLHHSLTGMFRNFNSGVHRWT
jgi:hypothetical protein